MKQFVRSALLVCTAALVIGDAFAAASAHKADDILTYVPANTPFVFASLEAMPDALAVKIEASIDETLSAYQRIVRYALAEKLVELAGEENGALEAEKLQGFVDSIVGLMSVEGIRNAGFQRDSAFALYGNGLLPVLRLALSSAQAFDDTIAGLQEQAVDLILTGEVDSETYRYIDLEDWRLLVYAGGDYAVLTIVPESFDEDEIAGALGLRKPRESLVASGQLQEVAAEYGYTGHLTGYTDVELVAGYFLGESDQAGNELLAGLQIDTSALSKVCKAEFKSIAMLAPRIVFGYTGVAPDMIRSQALVEIRQDIAAGLTNLPAIVPGLGTDPGGLFSFGFSLNLLAARAFYETQLDAIEEDPYMCPALAVINGHVPQGRAALAKPIPPIAYGFRGFLAQVSAIEGMEYGSDKPPESVDGSLLVAIEGAQDIIAMAALMNPQVAALNLLPNGEAVAISVEDFPQLSAVAEQAFAALSANALSVSLGAGAEQDVVDMLQGAATEPPPLLSFSFDAQQYYEIMAEAMMQPKPDAEGEETPVAIRAALRDVMLASASLYERMLFDVQLTSRGIAIDSRVTLVD